MDRYLFGLSDNFYIVNLISDRVYSLFCLFWPQIKICALHRGGSVCQDGESPGEQKERHKKGSRSKFRVTRPLLATSVHNADPQKRRGWIGDTKPICSKHIN